MECLSAGPTRRQRDTAEEQVVRDLLHSEVSDSHELLTVSKLPAIQFSTNLTMLEISGKIRPLNNNHHWAVK